MGSVHHGGCHPRADSMGYITKQPKNHEKPSSKNLSSTVSALVSASSLACVNDGLQQKYKPNQPFSSSQLLLAVVFLTATDSKLRNPQEKRTKRNNKANTRLLFSQFGVVTADCDTSLDKL